MSDIRGGEPTFSSDEPVFGGFDPPASPAPTPYRVLARKYRPQTFDDLIGQDAMVRTVTNSFAANRIPQAWMLTGVRGVGKTTTARILARALNYAAPGSDGRSGGPAIAMPELGVHCRSIMESRHIDVTEMDAASHTGVDNIRQITDGVRYGPVQARYKVYIVDEVHMLSTAAFNAFLKTLEEPPPHAKFVFATTEIRKVPVTVLSRCQRFDLRRVEMATLTQHLARICAAEAVEAEVDALSIIARAAEGSVRDALSLLDQAVAHGAGAVTAGAVRDMLGLADRGQVIDLFEAAMGGDVPRAFAALNGSYQAGADPGQTMSDLASFTHLVTRLKLVPEAAKDPALTEAERTRGAAFAERLTVRALSRAWQILLKAVPEVGASQRPLQAAEMALVRLAYASDLPTPDEVLRSLRREPGPPPATSPPSVATRPSNGGGSAGGAMRALAPAVSAPEPAQPVAVRSFDDILALASERREIALKGALERDVRLVRLEEGQLTIALAEGAARSLPNDLSRALGGWTGRRWVVAVTSEAVATPTVHEQRRQREEDRRTGAAGHPLVQAVLQAWPGSEIIDVRERADPAATSPDATDDGEPADDA